MKLTTKPFSPEDGPGVELDDAQIAALLAEAIAPLYEEIVQTLMAAGPVLRCDESDPPLAVSCHLRAVSYLHTALVTALRTLRAE